MRTFALSILLLITFSGNAQQLINSKVDILAGNEISSQNAVIYFPANYTTSKKYPLVISTHGIGQAGTDVNLLYNSGLPYVLKNGYKPSVDFIMIAPQRSSYSVDPSWLKGILEDARKRYPIDSTRMYLTGFDAGGWGTFGSQLNIDTALAKNFAAIVICSGATQDANKINLDWWKTSKTHLWAVVGNDDISYRDQNNYMVSEINKRVSGIASITIRSGIGHGGWNDVFKGLVKNGTLDIWQWMYQFKRDAKSISKITSTTSTTSTTTTSNTITATTTSSTGYKNYTLTTTDGDIWRPNGLGISGLKPGDTVNIPAGNYNLIELGAFKGDATHPIIIRNKGGLVTAKDFRLSHNAQYFKLLGNGKAGLTYGFKVVGNMQGTGLSAFASDFEVAYVEVTGTGAGFYMKKNPEVGDPLTQYPNYVMRNIKLLHNYIHNTVNEGMYIGHTYPNADPYNNNMIPIRLSHIEIAYNRVENTGWDGIQLANATDGCSIHDNSVYNFGTANQGGQQSGIIVGANTNANVYNNTITKGTGNGLEMFGYGYMKVYNNTITSTGYDGTSVGQESVFCNDLLVTVESRPEQQMNVYSNTIKYPKQKAAIRVAGYHNYTLASPVQYNKLLIPNAPSNWQSLYIFSVKGSTISGNTLITQ